MARLISYEKAAAELDRIEAECGCELPSLNSDDCTLANRARRVLNCDCPPKGEDRDFCYRILSGNAIAG